MRLARSITVPVLGAASLLACGCATTRYTESRIAAVPPGMGRAGSSSTLRIDEVVKLRIESLDRTPDNEAAPALRLRLSFDVREVGYSFDASQVLVRGRGAERWPARPLSEPRYEPLAHGSQFTLAFDVAVAGDTQLELVVAGLARGREKLAPVVLPLERRSGRSYDRLYWLEAIGAVLLAPLSVAGAAP